MKKMFGTFYYAGRFKQLEVDIFVIYSTDTITCALHRVTSINVIESFE